MFSFFELYYLTTAFSVRILKVRKTWHGYFGPGIFSLGAGGRLLEAPGIFRVLVYAPFDHLRHLKTEVHVPLPGPSSDMKTCMIISAVHLNFPREY